MTHDGGVMSRHLDDDRGDMLLSGLLKLLAFFAIVGLLIFEVGAIAVNRVQLDDAAGQAARAAAATAGARRTRPDQLQEAAQSTLPEDVRLEAVSLEGQTVEVTVSRQAPVLVLDRLGPLADWAEATVVKEATLR